jgi:hypothetical protein
MKRTPMTGAPCGGGDAGLSVGSLWRGSRGLRVLHGPFGRVPEIVEAVGFEPTGPLALDKLSGPAEPKSAALSRSAKPP